MVNQLRDSGIGFRYTADQAARFRQKGWWGDEILLDHLDRWTAEAPENPAPDCATACMTIAASVMPSPAPP